MSSVEIPSSLSSSTPERITTAPIRPRVYHIVSPITGSKATIITTDTTTTPNHAPILIQAPHRVNRPSINPQSNARKRLYPFTQEAETNAYLSTVASHRHRERLSKGLRYFSKKVCNKVQTKKITSYNEVATELVGEYTMEEKRSVRLTENELAYEQKNIRRRVYDAINVLLAMNIIVKDKKDIRWVGFPVNALFECELIDKKIVAMKETIREKIQSVEEALLRQVALRKLIARNNQHVEPIPMNRICFLPFFALTTFNGVKIESTFSRDGRNTIVVFDRRMQIKNETDCLHRLGFSNELRGQATTQEQIEQAQQLLPDVFNELTKEMAMTGSLKPLFDIRTPMDIKRSKSPPSVLYIEKSRPDEDEDEEEISSELSDDEYNA